MGTRRLCPRVWLSDACKTEAEPQLLSDKMKWLELEKIRFQLARQRGKDYTDVQTLITSDVHQQIKQDQSKSLRETSEI